MVVGSQKIQRRVEQASFLKAEEDRVSAVFCAKTTGAQAGAGAARIFFGIGQADFLRVKPAPLKDAQNIAGLADFKAWQRVEIGQHALGGRFQRGGRRNRQ